MNRRFFRPLLAVLLAGGMLAAATVPVLAGVTTSSPGVSGSAPAGTCEVTLSSTTSLNVVSSKPCGQGQAPTTCLVVLTSSAMPAPVEKTFNWSCASAFRKPYATGAGTPNGQFMTWYANKVGAYCTGSGLTGVTCAVSNMMTALNSGNVIGTLIAYTTGAMGLPFYAQNGLTSWITTTHQNALSGVYKVMAMLGFTVALFAAAFRVIAEVGQKGTHVGLLIIGAPVRLFFAIALILSFFALTQWAIPIFNNLAGAVYTAIMNGGANQVFTSSGHMNAQAVAGLAGAGIAGLLGAIVGTLLMIYLFIMLIIRDVILTFGLMLAPIAIGIGVYDQHNDMVMKWRNLFIGGLLMSLAGAVGVGVTFAIVGALLNSSAATSGPGWLLAIVMMVGGLFFTTRLMNEIMRGSMSHKSPTGLLLGMAEGAIIGTGAKKAIRAGSRTVGKGAGAAAKGAAGSAPISGAGSKVRDLGGAMGRLAQCGPAGKPSGAMAHASVGTQAALAGVGGGAMDTALASDSQAQQIIEAATAHMDPNTPTSARLAHMANSDQHHQVLNRMIENGVGKAQLLSGADPSQVRFKYHEQEMGSMLDLAHKAARASAAQTIKSARRGSMAP